MAEKDFEIDMEDSMRETFAEMQGDEPEEVEEVSEGRSRDDKGRFAAKAEYQPDKEPDEEEEPIAAEVDDEQDVDEPEPDIEPAPVESHNAPAAWTPAAKSLWNDVPERIRQEILKREEDSRTGIQRLKGDLESKAQFGSSMAAVVDPYRAIIESEGGTPETAVQEMLNSAYILRQGHPQQKAQMVLQLVQQYGFGNELVAMIRGGGQNTQQQAPAYDPRVDQLEKRLAEQDRLAEERSTQSVQQVIEDFTNAVDEDGSLVNPYFANVQDLMIPLLESGQKETLEEAYEAALWMHPETREILLGQRTSQTEGRRQVEAKERATKGRKANKVNLPKRGHHDSKPNKPTGSIEDTMRETMESLKS